VWGAHYLHDGAQPEGSGRRTRWGNCWVVVVLVVQLDCLGGRQVGLPILFRLFRPKDDARPDLDGERPSQPELARTLIDMILARFPTRVVELIMDGAYATKAWRGLPGRVTVTTRMRSNAAVFALAPPRTGKKGRPALKGARLGSLAQLAASAVFEAVTITAPDGRSRIENVATITGLWYGPFHTRPVVVMLIRKPDRADGFDVALASTDIDATTAELIARYDSRWCIETAHQEAKAQPTASAKPATASSAPCSGPSRSGSSRRRSRSSGTPCTATPKPTSTPADAPPRGIATSRPSATPTCSPRYAAT
jgi:hypothetical protein